MEKSKSGNAKPKVFDVAKPGKAAPSASSRPIIIGHELAISDPMVTTNAPQDSPQESAPSIEDPKPKETPQVVSHSGLRLDVPDKIEQAGTSQPDADSDSSTDVKEKPEDTKQSDEPQKSNSDSDTSQSEESDQKPVESQKTSADSGSPKTQEQAEINAVMDQGKKTKAQKEAEEAKAAQEAAAQKLIDEKKYVLPIGQNPHHTEGGNGLLLFFLVLLGLLVVAGVVYFLVDAQIIPNHINLPINFVN